MTVQTIFFRNFLVSTTCMTLWLNGGTTYVRGPARQLDAKGNRPGSVVALVATRVLQLADNDKWGLVSSTYKE